MVLFVEAGLVREWLDKGYVVSDDSDFIMYAKKEDKCYFFFVPSEGRKEPLIGYLDFHQSTKKRSFWVRHDNVLSVKYRME